MDREVQAVPEARVVLRRAHLVVTMPLMDHRLMHLLPVVQVARVDLVDPAAPADREAQEASARLPSP